MISIVLPVFNEEENIGEVYELGSVFKLLTIAMALDSGKVSLTDEFDATGKLQIGRHRIGDDHAQNRWLTVSEIFQHSSNIGTARMAFAAGGAPPLEEFFRKLGLYEPPQIADSAARGANQVFSESFSFSFVRIPC